MENLTQHHIDLIFIALLGLCFGSFNTMATYRLPRDLNWVTKPSSCSACGHRLGVLSLLPLVSWLSSLGKCRYCGAPIHWRYPVIELMTMVAFLLVYERFGASVNAIPMYIFIECMVIMIVVDFEFKIIPDSIHVVLIPTAIWHRLMLGDSLDYILLCGLMGLGIALSLRYGFFLWKKKEGLGWGDVKLFVSIGLFITPALWAPLLFISGVSGTVTAVFWKFLNKGEEFPFGPSLALALGLSLFFPNEILKVMFP